MRSRGGSSWVCARSSATAARLPAHPMGAARDPAGAAPHQRARGGAHRPMTPSLIGPVTAPELHVMTFNVRRRLGGLALRPADRWHARGPRVRALVRAERPTLLGVQEARADQADAVLHALGARYRFVGRGREAGGRGEGCPLYYDTERLQLLEWDQRALSDRRTWPVPVPGAISCRAWSCGRASSTASPASDSPRSTRTSIRSRSGRGCGPPARSGGSWPPGPSDGDHRRPQRVGRLGDAHRAAGRRHAAGRLVGRRHADDPRVGHLRRLPAHRGGARAGSIGSRHPPDVGVVRAGINARTVEGGWASDHLPVQAVIRLPRPRGAS